MTDQKAETLHRLNRMRKRSLEKAESAMYQGDKDQVEEISKDLKALHFALSTLEGMANE